MDHIENKERDWVKYLGVPDARAVQETEEVQ